MAIGSDKHEGNGYWFLTSDVIREFISGGFTGKKQNNIQEQLFRECPSVDEDQLVKELKQRLLV